FKYLHEQGFVNDHEIDIRSEPMKPLRNIKSIPESNIHEEDFFAHQGGYDLILEQTFFCALDPSLRDKYVAKMHDLLNPGGILAGVLFNFPLTEKGPPFGGNEEMYKDHFSKKLEIKKMETCYNSIPPRAGNELFFELKKN
ncbi:MAG: SAM-dependent methyltransferase, partial [Flavobacteriales bacterium]|nr:SAM-dependent methyltransferase [Flavobacteriales bacterium]